MSERIQRRLVEFKDDDGNTHIRPWGPADDKLEEMKAGLRTLLAPNREICASCNTTKPIAADSSHGPLCQDCAASAQHTMKIPTNRASPEAMNKLHQLISTAPTPTKAERLDRIEISLARIEAMVAGLVKKWL